MTLKTCTVCNTHTHTYTSSMSFNRDTIAWLHIVFRTKWSCEWLKTYIWTEEKYCGRRRPKRERERKRKIKKNIEKVVHACICLRELRHLNCIYLPNSEKLFIRSMISVWTRDLCVDCSFCNAITYGNTNRSYVAASERKTFRSTLIVLSVYFCFLFVSFFSCWPIHALMQLTTLMYPHWICASILLSLCWDGQLKDWFYEKKKLRNQM